MAKAKSAKGEGFPGLDLFARDLHRPGAPRPPQGRDHGRRVRAASAGQWSARKSQLLAAAYKKSRRRLQEGEGEEDRGAGRPRQVDLGALDHRRRRARHQGRRDGPLPPREGLGRADPGPEEGDRFEEEGRLQGGASVRRQHQGRQVGPQEDLLLTRV